MSDQKNSAYKPDKVVYDLNSTKDVETSEKNEVEIKEWDKELSSSLKLRRRRGRLLRMMMMTKVTISLR